MSRRGCMNTETHLRKHLTVSGTVTIVVCSLFLSTTFSCFWFIGTVKCSHDLQNYVTLSINMVTGYSLFMMFNYVYTQMTLDEL